MQHTYRIYDKDGNLVEESDNPRTLRDGEGLVVPVMMRDDMSPVQQAIATDAAVRAVAQPSPKRRSGYVFDSANNHATKMKAYDELKVRLSNAYKGGTNLGDIVNYGGSLRVVDSDPDSGRPVLRSMSAADGDARKQAAYNDGVRNMTDAWAKKPKAEKEEKDPDDNEWQMAGPLSDGKSGQEVRDQAWRDSVTALENAWRK